MSDLVGNPEDRFSRVAAQMISVFSCNRELYGNKVIIRLKNSSEIITDCFNKYDNGKGILNGKHRNGMINLVDLSVCM